MYKVDEVPGKSTSLILHNHAELQLVPSHNVVLLRLEFIDVPLAIDEAS